MDPPTSTLPAPPAPPITGITCSSEPTSPGPRPTGPADVAEHAFLLTIDVATGRVTVREPQQTSRSTAGRAGGPSFSLLGSDAIALHAGDCIFSTIPNNGKQKSCSMQLSIENRLSSTDLVTPTNFPRPPAGGTGILVSPYTAAGLGVPGGTAVPNASWDGAPANFFNDFSGCTTGKTSDCYRWESYSSPTDGGATSETRTVGFDVDKNANSVGVYLVVAADLRDNPIQTLTVLPEPGNCGYRHGGFDPAVDPDTLRVTGLSPSIAARTLCSFDIHALPADAKILSANLRVFQTESSGVAESFRPVVVDHMDYGTLETLDFTRAALTSNIGNFPVMSQATIQTLAVLSAVTADLAASRSRSQFRLRLATETTFDPAGVRFAGPTSGVPPELTITYRKR